MKSESVFHILTICSVYSDIRERLIEKYSFLCLQSKSQVDFSEILFDPETLCQFILDPTSINLKRRINPNDALIESFFQLSRDVCSSINIRRLKLLKTKEESTNS